MASSVHDEQTADLKAKHSKSTTPFLDEYGVDLIKAAQDGKIDPLIGRVKEIERTAQILSRRKKNNPIIIGDSGAGKSAIAHGLALSIVNKTVPHILLDKRIIEIESSTLLAGAKYRGEMETRIKEILKEVETEGNIILFFDEIHALIGASSGSSASDVSNMIKPHLSAGRLQIIGATTTDEYRKHIEKDSAFARRFIKVDVRPTSVDDTIEILKRIKVKYEEHHHVFYTDEAIEACVRLTDRYISDRHLPDKAIDAMDETGSRVHITNIVLPEAIRDLEKQLDDILVEKSHLVKTQKYEAASEALKVEKKIKEDIEDAKKSWENNLADIRIPVGANDVAEVVSMASGIPINNVNKNERQRLKNMEETISSKVIGQDKAVNSVTNAIKRTRLGIKDKSRPQAVFLMIGSSGTGKTHLAKVVAKELFGENSLIRIDMNEFSEKISITKLLGSPAGYVGYNDSSSTALDEIRRKPYSVVLLDEMEKAHKEVLNVFLQAFDEGHITDNRGIKTDLKNCIIIMTSNIGVKRLKEMGTGVGFNTKNDEQIEQQKEEFLKKELSREFPPEFINRIDEIVYFNALTKDDIYRIVDLELVLFTNRLKDNKYNVSYTSSVIEFVAANGYDPNFGARKLKRFIQANIENILANDILDFEIDETSDIVLDMNEAQDKVVVRVNGQLGETEIKLIEESNNTDTKEEA